MNQEPKPLGRFRMLILLIGIVFLTPFSLLVLAWFTLTGNEQRFRLIALGFDCTGNATLNGDYRETVSSRAGRRWPRSARFINWLFSDPNHCKDAIEFTRHETTRGMNG